MSKKGTIPYNEDVERDLALGAILYQPYTADIAGELSPEDFYVPLYSHIWEIFLDLYCDKGQTFTSATVVDECERRGWPINPADLITLNVNGYKPIASHIDVIRRDALTRRLLSLTAGMSNQIVDGADPYEILDDISRFTKDLGEVNREPTAITMEELIEASVDGAPWVIPGLMKQDWRALLVASEGGSKSTVLRALLMCASQGFHALDNRGIVFRDRIAIDPQRTLLCDFENPSDAITETGALLMNHLQQVSPDYDSTRFRMWRQLEGFNLRKRSDRAELIREITFQKPTIVSMGPWYKMGRRKAGEGYEDVADDMLAILDELRTKYGFALFLEHHAPKGQGAQRVLDPFGSQRLLAWPDLGLSLRPVPDTDNLDIERHRGDRMKNDWPTMIVRDPKWLIRGSWPLPPFGT